MDSAIVTLIAIGFLSTFTLSALFVEVAREEAARERTATDELWSRDLDFYTQHLNEKPATGDTVTGRESSRSGLRPVRQENVTRAAQG
jgi:hypothetical protein